MICYKFTDAKQTCLSRRYDVGVQASAGSNGVINAYRTPEDAVFFDCIHGKYLEASHLFWECEGAVVVDKGTKLGVESITLIRRISAPELTVEYRLTRAINAARGVFSDPEWVAWADKWLSGEDRSAASALRVQRLCLDETCAADAAFAAAHAVALADTYPDRGNLFAALAVDNSIR
jgi:hypothetical protein